jgi:DNA-binding transcriptional regulator YiaG
LLASVEYGRNPLRYWLADRLCEKFDVCQQWLAIGEEPLKGYVGLPPETGLEIAHRELFSVAYERRIGHMVRQQIQDTESLKRSIAAQAGGADKLLEDRLYNLALCWFGRIPVHLYDEYFRELMAASSDFFKRNRHRFSTGTWPPPALGPASATQHPLVNKSQEGLDMYCEVRDKESVQTPIESLDDLMKRVREKTSIRGARAGLARELNVSRQAVDQWLSGETCPAAEITIRLVNWVKQPNRQQNTPGSITSTTKGKTQVRSSTVYEKTKSSPPKR